MGNQHLWILVKRHDGLDKVVPIPVCGPVTANHESSLTEAVFPVLGRGVRSIRSLLIAVLFFTAPTFASEGAASPESFGLGEHNPDQPPIEEIVVNGSKPSGWNATPCSPA